MNPALLHITLVHIPIVLLPLGALLLAIAHMRSSVSVARVALGILIGASVVAVPAFLLGEGAEEIVEHLPGISETVIEDHEEVAEVALWVTVATGIASLITWVAIARGAFLERALLAVTFLLSSTASIALTYTAYLGGAIHHPEIHNQHNPTAAHTEHE